MRCRECAKPIVFATAVLLDRLSKAWAAAVLKPQAAQTFGWDGVIRLRYAENTGAAFSMLSGRHLILIIVTLLLLCGILVYMWKNRPQGLGSWGLWLILAGGFSNVFDRIAYGYVVDMIEPLFMRFAVFNLADTWVCVGIVMMLISAFLGGGRRAVGVDD